MAPGANVLYYGAASCYDDDLLASLAKVVGDNNASIVTNSWGEPTFVNIPEIGCTPCITIDDSLVNAYESVFEQGAVQGIGFYFSSGDNGDELDAWGVKHPDWPTEDPWVTSVGGTSLAVNQANQRSFETGWGTSKWALSGNTWVNTVPFLYGAGGGFTYLPEFNLALFDRPWYQDGVVQSSTPGRAVPDIAADADPTTGMLVGETQNFTLPSRFGPAGVHYGEYRIGGTSLASPLMAGMQAVAQGHDRIGFANPLIYSLAHSGVYYDVTPQGDAGNVRSDFVNGQNADNGLAYSVRTFDQDSSLTTGPGWDDVTGVGSPTSGYFALFQNRFH
jgi:subtilase family serine protease